MADNGMQRQLKAILCADVKGYGRLMGEDGESTVKTITAYRQIIAEWVTNHQGRVVDSPADNILAEFGSTQTQTALCVKMIKKPVLNEERFQKIWQNCVYTLKDTYEMNP
jgi:class 3 adenylate cyclase